MSRLGQNLCDAEIDRESVGISPVNTLQFHEHTWGEMIYVLRGVVVLHLTGSSWLIPPNYCFWIPAGVWHRGGPIGSCDICFWRGPEKSVATLPKEPCLLDISRQKIQILRPFSIERKVSPKDAVSLLENAKAAEFPLRYPRTKRIQQITDQFVVAPSTTSNLEACSCQAGMSRRTFTRQFRQETGVSVGSWVQRLKCMQARQLLEKDLPIDYISQFLGYRSPSAFVAMFRREMHSTLGAYKSI
jgi:AraC-like DNA-binding protein